MEKKNEVKSYRPGKYILRASSKHPQRKYKVLDITVDEIFQEYTLDEAQAKELGSPGARAWVEHGTQKQLEAAKKLKKIVVDPAKIDAGSL
jgi:hypothetical protein